MYPKLAIIAAVVLCAPGCQTKTETVGPSPEISAESPTPSNRIDIPPSVRRNLGITFANAEARSVASTIRAPGKFELAPDARREHRMMLAGRVELAVTQFERVEPGDLLFSIDSPQWRELQRRLHEIESNLLHAEARASSFEALMAAQAQHHRELQRASEIWAERAERLAPSRESGAISEAELARVQIELSRARAALAGALTKEAQLRADKVAAEAERNSARERFELLLMNASSLLGMPAASLTEPDPGSPEGHPRWREIRLVEIRTVTEGIVETLGLTSGAWAAESSLVLTTVQPQRVRFRAMALQSDLPRLLGRNEAIIVPPRSPGIDIGDSAQADLTIGLEAHPDERTITLIAAPRERKPWMRAGVSAFLEIVGAGSDERALAIPRSAIVKDGLTHVFFRRDPANPNQAIRVEADLGTDDGRWVVINSGLALGDEVVLDGAFELKLATAQSGQNQKGGHFHADGSFHGEH